MRAAVSVTHFDQLLATMIDDITRLVSCESPSADPDAVARSATVVAELGSQRLGVPPERIVADGCTHLRWRLGPPPHHVLLLGHHDTVWPLGSIDTNPCTVRDGLLRGPGCFDMKAGLAMAFHALALRRESGGVTLLVTGDEEIGSPTSRQLIEDEAARCAASLVLEPSAPGGALKCERKGISNYVVNVTGRASHAGLDPEAGVNASVEIARQIIAVSRLGDLSAGTTVTPTVMSAGTATNVVPANGRFAVDVRVETAAEQDRVHTALTALRPTLAGATIDVRGGPNRPPLPRAASAELFARAAAVADRLGLAPLAAVSVGGGSDGNFTADVGSPTLDGLGAVGGGAHADDEHVVVDELPARTALLCALVDELLGEVR